jgi:radical SAM family uncharacterized protein
MLPDHLLARVQKPGRYIGAEFNAVSRDPAATDLRMALCYPDVYEVGMSHVGSQVLYHVANLQPGVLCERAFYPGPDLAALLREEGLPLPSLETGTPLCAFDLVGVTLQHELTYPTIAGLLEMGGIPALSADRNEDHPLVIAGGPCAANPEPLAEVIDAFVLGDGEDVLVELVAALQARREAPREERVRALAALEGVYVPAVHDPARDRIRRRVVGDLNAAPVPDRPIVPYVEVVHDRAQIEVARGCTRGCRFCQAGILYRPVRQRDAARVRALAREIIANTGYDELSLVSLNCPDYQGIGELVDGLHRDLGDRQVSVGLPSLRIDTFSVDLARKVQRVRKSGLTFAPEAGSQRLRDAINKGVTEEDLLDTVAAAFSSGWHLLKLYFMIGLPTETDEDVLAIPALVKAVARVGREILGKKASRLKLNVSVSNFVPKVHTPLQWEGQVPREELLRRQDLIRATVRDRQVNVSFHDVRQSVVEAALARGARQTGRAVLAAYRAGGALDAWSEHFDFRRWQEAFAAVGLDVDQEATRSFATDEALPWDHMDTGVSRDFLLAERERVQTGVLTSDCRLEGCAGCGLGCRAEGSTLGSAVGDEAAC